MEVETGESATQETDGETGDVSWELEAGGSGPTWEFWTEAGGQDLPR